MKPTLTAERIKAIHWVYKNIDCFFDLTDFCNFLCATDQKQAELLGLAR